MNGTVFSIEEFSVYDGPGIRTSVFLKGCPLTCSWCHNPEGQKAQPEIVRSPNGCTECGNCLHFSKRENNQIVYTEKSIQNCPMHLLRVCGEIYDSDALCQKLLKNERILKNGGGITFSGGEPFMQSDFLFECLLLLKDKLHTAIQTSGYCSTDALQKALLLADYFLFDLKIAEENEHIRHTGVSNKKILQNFKLLCQSGKDFVVRIPLIPTVTDTQENITQLCNLMQENGVSYAELLPYNKMAGGKYKMVGRTYCPTFDETVDVSVRTEIFEQFHIKIKVL